MTFIAVAVAGGLGSGLRWLASLRVEWPGGTLAVNLVGSFALGALLGLAEERAIDAEMVEVVGTGLLGGFTTFSAFAVDTIRLGRVAGAVYAMTTITGSLALAGAGWMLAS